MPTTSVISVTYEERLVPFTAILNKLLRIIGTSTLTTLVQAATGVDDLIARLYATLRSGTIDLQPPEVRLLVQRLEQHLKLMQRLGLIDDTITVALLTVNSASAATDLGYLVAGVITLNGYDRTSEATADFDGNTAYAVTG